MADTWVVNASPLIALGNVGRVDLLTRLGREVVLPPAVVEEVRRGRPVVLPAGAIELNAVEPARTVLMWGLGSGETEVLSYAVRNPHAEAILDDLAARRCAQAHDVRTRGTVGVIVMAKQLGLIAAVRPVFDDLQRAGFYLSASVLQVALQAAGES